MKVSSVIFSSAVVFISTSPEITNAQDGRFDAGYDATILLKWRSKASLQTIEIIRNPESDLYRIHISISWQNHLWSKDLKRACPDGVDHCICANNVNESTSGPFFYDEDPLGVIHTYLICNPGICFCKGDPSTPTDTRPDAMKAVLDVCPTGEMNRCLCHDNTKVQFPFDYQTLFLDCRPKRVRESNRLLAAIGLLFKTIRWIPDISVFHVGTIIPKWPYFQNNLYCIKVILFCSWKTLYPKNL